MRLLLYCLVVLCAVTFIVWLYMKTGGDLSEVLWVGFILVVLGVGVFKFINVNTVPEDINLVVEKIVDSVGENIVRVNSNDDIEVKIKEKWIVASELDILYWVTEGIVIEYGGKRIKIMDSGVISALKFLDRMNFLN